VVDADPLHAGVDLEVHLRPRPVGGRRVLDVAQAGEGRDREGEAVLEEEGDLPGPDPAHHEDRVLDPEAAKGDALLDERDPERVGLRGEAAGDRLEAVAVGVGLEDRHHPGRRGAGLHRGQVGAETAQAHDRVRRPEPGLLGVERGVEVQQSYGRRFAFSVPE
jgi:hypothetical protein